MEQVRKFAVLRVLILVSIVAGMLLACEEGSDPGGTEKTWHTAQLLEFESAGNAHEPQIAMDSNGNALAVWEQRSASRANIWASRYTPATGWGPPELVETNDDGDAKEPQVVLDGNGNGLAIWAQYDGLRHSVWANRYTPTAGWDTPELIEITDGEVVLPQLAVNSGGTGVAVWWQFSDSRWRTWSNRYSPANGWGTAEAIDADAGQSAYPQVAIDADGNSLAVWQQYDGYNYKVWSNRFTPSSGWGTASLIQNDATTLARRPQIALDGSGNGLAVWQEHDGVRFNVWARRFTPVGGWGAAQLIETNDAGEAILPQIALNDRGDGLVAWAQSDGMRYNGWANRFSPASGWGTAEVIETDDARDAFPAQVALDPDGNGLAVWAQQNSAQRFDIWANRFTPAAGWGTAQLIETNSAGDAWTPQVVLDADGNGLAVWTQYDGSFNSIWANEFR